MNLWLLLFTIFIQWYVMPALPISKEDHPLLSAPKPKVLRMLKEAANLPEYRSVACDTCTLLVDGIQTMIKSNKTDMEIDSFVIDVCIALKLQPPYVCSHLIWNLSYEVYFVMGKTIMTPNEFCGILIHGCGTPARLEQLWNMTIPDGKPTPTEWQNPMEGSPTYRVLHLSDVHIDRKYEAGAETLCDAYICCRDNQDSTRKSAGSVKLPAGPWGMPNACDIPFQTFASMLKHISETEKDLDYIILTGDFEAHDIWDYTRELTTANVQNITATLLQYFPTTPIYVSIGNHEGVPSDSMAPHIMDEYEERGPQWLYSVMKDMWGHWLPHGALITVQYRASYVIYPKPGLKLISINSIYCSEFNFYLYIDQVDPDSTLEWLIEELQRSEDSGEKVHIISHIPPGSSYCLEGWSYNFNKIINRYESTIAGMFFGHTHLDEFEVFYDFDDPKKRPFHYDWIAPSITTGTNANPAYRIYDIDGGYSGATYHVAEANTFFGDVLEANANNREPDWKLLYNTRAEYDMIDLSPKSWDDLINRLENDADLFQKFMTWVLYAYSAKQKLLSIAK